MKKQKVIILGGGVAGLSAAHELKERKIFDVEVYELKAEIGGKAKSFMTKRGTDGDRVKGEIPIEHGFRFFPGFYQHITDTMKRIPVKENEQWVRVYDNLRSCPVGMLARYDKPPIKFPTAFPPIWMIGSFIRQIRQSGLGVTSEEKILFLKKIWQLMTSCQLRLDEQLEETSWEDYLEASAKYPSKSSGYKSLFVAGLTRTLVAARAREISTKTGGKILIQLFYDIFKFRTQGADRVLNGPTHVKWLNPWREYLTSGNDKVKFSTKCRVQSLIIKDGKMIGFTYNGREVINDEAIYVLALPVEDVWEIIKDNSELQHADESFKNLNTLSKNVRWMSGIQFFLNKEMDINHGHIIYTDSEWAITSISQLQFWDKDWVSKNISSEIKHIISADVSDWENKSETNKIAMQCKDKQEIKEEILRQINKSLKLCRNAELHENDNVLTYHLDRAIQKNGDANQQPDENTDDFTNEEPLLINVPGSWKIRPKPATKIGNLFLAGDYVQTGTDLATMEGANEAARLAVNEILDLVKYNGKRCKTFKLYNPIILRPFQWLDEWRYKRDRKSYFNSLKDGDEIEFKKIKEYDKKGMKLVALLLLPLIIIFLLFSFVNLIVSTPKIVMHYSHLIFSKDTSKPGC